ncbi:hypothetical protein BH10BDE1_BH10BDE1_08380 [soil metagenome]
MGTWRWVSLGLLIFAMIEFGLLIREGGSALLKSTSKSTAVSDEGFEAFEGIGFAREFSERFQTFDSRTFKATQTATAFLLDDDERTARLSEIERLGEKIERRDVTQKAHLISLMKLPGGSERFRADLDVELTEGTNSAPVNSRFVTRLEFSIARTARSEQNPWGFRVRDLTQSVIQPSAVDAVTLVTPTFVLRPKVATLLRFPCSIENVELPKATSIRVKLTTLDISELQLKTETPLTQSQVLRAVCRGRVFTMKIEPESVSAAATEPLVVLKSLTLANSTVASTLSNKKMKHRKTDDEKSIESQLGFVIEEE